MAEEPRASLRACIVGGGLMGRWHADSIAAIGGRIVAVVDRDPEAARILAVHHGVQTFPGLPEALSASQIDIVHICTPLEMHLELATIALEHGAHIVVEKPLAATFAETEKLLALATSRELLLAPVHQYSFQRGFLDATSRIAAIGKVQRLFLSVCSAGGDEAEARTLDDVLDEILPHPISIAVALGMTPDRESLSVLAPRAGELAAVWASPAGELVSVSISMNSRPPHNSGVLAGDRGTFHFDFFHGFSFLDRGWKSRWRKAASPFEHSGRTVVAGGTNLLLRAARREPAYPGLRELIRRIYAAVAEGKPSPIPPDAALAVARIRDDVLQSATNAREAR